MQWARETRELRQGVFHLVEWNYDQYEGVTLKQIHEGARRAGRSSAMDETASRRFTWVRMGRAGPGTVRPMAMWRYSPWGLCRTCSQRAGSDCRRGHAITATYPVRNVPLIAQGAKIDRRGGTMSETNGERSTREPPSTRAITRDRYDAVLLDLDGVITDTASIHAACWKQMFDEYLQKRATQRGEAFRPFDIASDYRLYVDGEPRYDGVRDFLTSRGIKLPEGSPDDPPQIDTVCGLGNRKNQLVNEVIHERGVEPYEGSVELIGQLRHRGFKIAVVTSSENCTTVLKAAKLDHFFDVQVDGNVIHAQHLAGKPAPDTYLMAARLLRVEPMRAVVIEDALSGVEAGSNGNFGLVIGVARKGNADELRRHGAHLVVNDLGQLVD